MDMEGMKEKEEGVGEITRKMKKKKTGERKVRARVICWTQLTQNRCQVILLIVLKWSIFVLLSRWLFMCWTCFLLKQLDTSVPSV